MRRSFKEICLKLFAMVSSKTCDMIFSTDMYHTDSFKSMERRRRGNGDKFITKGASTKKPKCWKEFLSNGENKHQLINYTVQMAKIQILIKCRKLKYSQGETDTRVILHYIYAKQKDYKSACTRNSDSDIFFICLYYAKT